MVVELAAILRGVAVDRALQQRVDVAMGQQPDGDRLPIDRSVGQTTVARICTSTPRDRSSSAARACLARAGYSTPRADGQRLAGELDRSWPAEWSVCRSPSASGANSACVKCHIELDTRTAGSRSSPCEMMEANRMTRKPMAIDMRDQMPYAGSAARRHTALQRVRVVQHARVVQSGQMQPWSGVLVAITRTAPCTCARCRAHRR